MLGIRSSQFRGMKIENSICELDLHQGLKTLSLRVCFVQSKYSVFPSIYQAPCWLCLHASMGSPRKFIYNLVVTLEPLPLYEPLLWTVMHNFLQVNSVSCIKKKKKEEDLTSQGNHFQLLHFLEPTAGKMPKTRCIQVKAELCQEKQMAHLR